MKLEDKLLAYSESEDYAFHMPGHKRRGNVNGFLGGRSSLSAIDITEIPGFDDLHDPQDILKEEMERAAAFYGTKATIFSVNGSTASNLTALSAAVPFGGRVLIAENCHRSIPHAVELRHLKADVIRLGEIAPDVPGPVTAEMVEAAFAGAEEDKASGASGASRYDAVVITSPTYEGVVSDVAAIAQVVHAHGALLIVDEAHGAHLSLHPAFPVSAVKAGETDDMCRADLVTQSLHKTLPSLTQTSVLHNVTGRVSTDELMRWIDIYETSSPSYILMASITSCLHLIMEKGPGLFDSYVKALTECRAGLGALKKLELVSVNGPGCAADPSKIVIGTKRAGISGQELADRLRREHHLVFEKTTPYYALAMTSVADTQEGFDRLTRALYEIDGSLAEEGSPARTWLA